MIPPTATMKVLVENNKIKIQYSWSIIMDTGLHIHSIDASAPLNDDNILENISRIILALQSVDMTIDQVREKHPIVLGDITINTYQE